MVEQNEVLLDLERYIGLVRELIYLTIIRPSQSFAIGVISRFMQAPRIDHWNVVLHILKDFKKALEQGLLSEDKGSAQISGYGNVD